MPEYIIAYKGGSKPSSREEGAAQMARWKQWTEELGDAIINPGTPLSGNRIVSATAVSADGGDNSMSGYSVVKAQTMDEALEMAKKCPFLDTGGTLEVAQIMVMG